MLVVLWRLRYKLSLRDVTEMFLVRGVAFTHETAHDWEARCAPLSTAPLRAQRKGKVGRSWYVDATYLRVGGHWCYRYRAIDRDGNLVHAMLSETSDMEAVKRFFKQAKEVTGGRPEQVTTAGPTSDPRAIGRVLGSKVRHRTNRYLNNRLGQEHRGVKQGSDPMRGFGNCAAAARFCRACDEQRDDFRAWTKPKGTVRLAEQRRLFRQRFAARQDRLVAA